MEHPVVAQAPDTNISHGKIDVTITQAIASRQLHPNNRGYEPRDSDQFPVLDGEHSRHSALRISRLPDVSTLSHRPNGEGGIRSALFPQDSTETVFRVQLRI